MVSTLGEGSKFWFTLPFNKSGRRDDEENEIMPCLAADDFPKGRRILLVEDNEVLIAMIRDMLKLHQHDVAVAYNGAEAIEIALKHKPELILTDIRMPVMGGLQLSHWLREFREFAETPIIALTATTGRRAREDQLAAGCTDHLAKPFQSKDLYVMIKKYLWKE